ncbi:MAG: Fic family protein, partial [Pyrinomonadaceae bacterium]
MKIPQAPPPFEQLLRKQKNPSKIFELARPDGAIKHYLHWDRLRRYPNPPGLTAEDRWLATKFQRLGILKPLPLRDKQGQPFQFCVPEMVLEDLHRIDVGAGGSIGVPEPITNPQTRDQYLVRSLIEEAITSSQLEGAATTREVAKEMIRTGRPPRDIDEQMIMNNYITMRRITELREETLSPKMVFEIHRLVTDKTLPDSSAAGRFRNANEERVVGGNFGEVYHQPPQPNELPARLEAMCEFGNGKVPDFFIHPVIRAIALHFWLAYDHPFVDGNGRTARALFYWSMLSAG